MTLTNKRIKTVTIIETMLRFQTQLLTLKLGLCTYVTLFIIMFDNQFPVLEIVPKLDFIHYT